MAAAAPTTRTSDIFSAELILLGLKQRTRHAVVTEMVDRLDRVGFIDSEKKASLVQVIMVRETMGSTALGNGIAMPHCRTNLTDHFMGVIAIDRKGIDFCALDRAPVRVVFLLVGPLDQRERYFEVLGRISSLLWDKPSRMQLLGARSPAEVVAILEEYDGFR